MMTASSSEEHRKHKNDENPEPNYNDLMEQLKTDIIGVYPSKDVQNDTDLMAKNAI